MPTIACPGCQKQYKLPMSAAGQIATCKACGRKFRIGASKKAPKPNVAKSVPTSAPAVDDNSIDDDFWDDQIPESGGSPAAVPSKPLAPTHVAPTNPIVGNYLSDTSEEYASAQRRKEGVRWGFQWEKVAGGGVTFLIATAITVGLFFATGKLYFLPAGIAVVGFFTMLTGLMGEDGVW